MGLLFWKKNRQIDQFAYQLADNLYSQVLPDMAQQIVDGIDSSKGGKSGKDKKKLKRNQEQIKRTMDDITLQMQQYKMDNKLGVYGKARLHMTFTERLEELGYNKDVAKELSNAILVRSSWKVVGFFDSDLPGITKFTNNDQRFFHDAEVQLQGNLTTLDIYCYFLFA